VLFGLRSFHLSFPSLPQDQRNAVCESPVPPHSLRSEATHSLARLLRPFVVTFYVYTFNHKPEEKWKFPITAVTPTITPNISA
jgi:hypothetical protein